MMPDRVTATSTIVAVEVVGLPSAARLLGDTVAMHGGRDPAEQRIRARHRLRRRVAGGPRSCRHASHGVAGVAGPEGAHRGGRRRRDLGRRRVLRACRSPRRNACGPSPRTGRSSSATPCACWPATGPAIATSTSGRWRWPASTMPSTPSRSAGTDQSGDATPIAAPPMPLALSGTAGNPFVGRADSLMTLARTWSDAGGDTGRVVLVGGEAGAGKTRLAAEFARRVHAGGAAVLYGACDDDLALPYQPWVQAFDPVLPALARSRAGLPAGLAPLAPLMTNADQLVPTGGVPTGADPDAERYRRYAAFSLVLEAVAAHWPTAGRARRPALGRAADAGAAASPPTGRAAARRDDRGDVPGHRRRGDGTAGLVPGGSAARRRRAAAAPRGTRRRLRRAVRRRRGGRARRPAAPRGAGAGRAHRRQRVLRR